MPADNIEGFRRDVLQLLRELDAPVYRWPGGNFVSGYDWRDGVGERDTRPPRKNPAWKGVEHNDVGIHEFMALCRLIATKPYVAVNSGLGDAASAANQVEYVNGAPEALDVAAAWREDGKTLTLSIVNPTRETQTLALTMAGATFAQDARLWRLAGTDEKAYNEPGKPPAVSFEESKGEHVPANGPVAVPPMSISLYELKVAR